MIGEQVGSYKIVDTLGMGGMGVVYVAEHGLLGKRAAIKVLRPELSRDPEVVQRFFNEAKAATLIRHPCIVEVFDFGHLASGAAYLAMELLEGESLGVRLQRERRLRAHVAVAIMRQVAGGIAAAHDKGIVHRDLKPDNIFLVPHPESPSGLLIKVLDFGIAKLVGDGAESAVATRTGAILGTPLYMSPEQCRGIAQIDQRSDLYSLGCILYHLLAGRPPFLGEGVGDIIGAHIHVPPAPLGDQVPGVPKRLEQLVMQLLAKKPDDRPDGMAKVGRALDQILATPSLEMVVGVAPAPDPGLAPDPLLITDVGIYGPTAATGGPSHDLGHAATMDTPAPRDTEPDPPRGTATLAYPSASTLGDSTTLGGSAGERPARPAGTTPSRRIMIGGAIGAIAVGAAGLAWWARSDESAARPAAKTMTVSVLFSRANGPLEPDDLELQVGGGPGAQWIAPSKLRPAGEVADAVAIAFVIDGTAPFLTVPAISNEIRHAIESVRGVAGLPISAVVFDHRIAAFHDDGGNNLMHWLAKRREAANEGGPATALGAAITEAAVWLGKQRGHRIIFVIADQRAYTEAAAQTIAAEIERSELHVHGVLLADLSAEPTRSPWLKSTTMPVKIGTTRVIPATLQVADFEVPVASGPTSYGVLRIGTDESNPIELTADELLVASFE